MKKKRTARKSNQVARPTSATASAASSMVLSGGAAGKLATDGQEVGSLDRFADGLVDRVDKFFTRNVKTVKFLWPVLLSFVGCLAFAGFDAFSGTHAKDDFTSEHVAALGHPYFLLGGLFLSLHLLLARPDGRRVVGKWGVGTFSKLVEHALLFGLGVFLWLSIVELFTKPSWNVAWTSVWVITVLLFLAKLFQVGAKHCTGEYFELFDERPGRQSALRVLGAIFVCASLVDCNHFIQKERREVASRSAQSCAMGSASSVSNPASNAASH